MDAAGDSSGTGEDADVPTKAADENVAPAARLGLTEPMVVIEPVEPPGMPGTAAGNGHQDAAVREEVRDLELEARQAALADMAEEFADDDAAGLDVLLDEDADEPAFEEDADLAEDEAPIGSVESARPTPERVMARVSSDFAQRVATDAEPPLPTGSAVQVRCFGGLSVWSGERELTPFDGQRNCNQSWEALAFLAAQPEGHASKDKMMLALWDPDTNPDDATNRLHTVLVRLRRVVNRQVPGAGKQLVRLGSDGICRLDRATVSSDVQRFAALCHTAPHLEPAEAITAYEEIRRLYRGDLLDGCSYDWAYDRSDSGVSLQERYRDDYYVATRELGRLYASSGRNDDAIRLFREVLRVEPTLEDVARDLYRCYEGRGDRAALVREHERLRHALGAVQGRTEPAEPGPETTALYRDMLRRLDAQPGSYEELRASA